ncbi:MAG: type II secretion system F family protein [Dehalococcoidales bacterium]
MYQYKAYTLDKEIVQGTIDAPNESSAEELLHGAGYHQILTLNKKPSPFSLEKLFLRSSRVKKSDIIDFFQQLATLLDSQMPFIQALWLLAEQTTSPALKGVIHQLGQDVSAGAPFSLALAKYPKLLSSHYCQVIKVSEKSGELPRGLRLVAGYMDKETTLTSHIRRTLSYPAFLGGMAVIVIMIIATVAVPSLTKLFNSLGVNLPLVTKMLVAFAGFVMAYKFYLLVGIIAIVVMVLILKKQPGVKKFLDALTLKMPIIGKIIIMRNVCRFCRSSAMLIEAGLTLPQALIAIIGTIDSNIIRAALVEIRQDIIKGKGLSQPMQKSGFFPRLLVDVVAIGERTGTLQSSFSKMADYYEKRLDMRVQRLLAMVEPASIILAGLVIGFIGVAIFMPLYSIYQNVG